MRKSTDFLIIICLFVFLFVFSEMAFAADKDEDLLKITRGVLGPLPSAMTSDQNSITPEKVKLGEILFYETRISVDGTVSCARCHPFSLYGADGLRKAIGHDGQVNPRNAPTVLNAAGQISEHWIGNRQDVEDQAKQSVLGAATFGMPSYEAVEKKLREIAGYPPLFQKAFPGDKDPMTPDNFGKAVGAFERTLVTPSSFDAFLRGNKEALTDTQKRGLKTFMDIGCVTCHSGAFVGGQMYQKFGIFELYWKYTKSKEIDEGRYVVTKNEADKYVFKVPVLRNVEKTAPYFHDGSVDKLEDAVIIMGKIQLRKDLSTQQNEEIISFLDSLTGEIPTDALEVPLLPSME